MYKHKHKWHEIIQAYLNHETIQYHCEEPLKINPQWTDVNYDPQHPFPDFNYALGIWRIKPNNKEIKVKMALCRNNKNKFYIIGVHDSEYEQYEKSYTFVKWITNEMIIEIPEEATFGQLV